MISIRRNVFETNSSSTHSLTMCSESDYDKWKNGELYYNNRYYCEFEEYGDLISKEQIIEGAKKLQKRYKSIKENEPNNFKGYMQNIINLSTDEEILKHFLPVDEDDNSYFETFDAFWNRVECDYETFEDNYITKEGTKVIAFGYFGYDG